MFLVTPTGKPFYRPRNSYLLKKSLSNWVDGGALSGSGNVYTYSGFLRITAVSTHAIWGDYMATSPRKYIYIDSSGRVNFYSREGVNINHVYAGTVFNSVDGAFHHIVVAVDSSQASQANRIKIYIDGVLQTNTSVSDSGSYTTSWSYGIGDFGRYGTVSTVYSDMYQSEVVLDIGSQRPASDFVDIDGCPIDLSAMNPDVWLQFMNSSNLGENSGALANLVSNNHDGTTQSSVVPAC